MKTFFFDKNSSQENSVPGVSFIGEDGPSGGFLDIKADPGNIASVRLFSNNQERFEFRNISDRKADITFFNNQGSESQVLQIAMSEEGVPEITLLGRVNLGGTLAVNNLEINGTLKYFNPPLQNEAPDKVLTHNTANSIIGLD